MEKFEYQNNRFTKEPQLYSDKPHREIHLSTFNEHFVLSVAKDTNGGQFSILFNVLSDLMPKVEVVAATMHDMATQLKGGCFLSELKQGVVWDGSPEGRFREDRWYDDMTFEKWCSVKQIANEFYGNKKRPQRKPTFAEQKINLTDLLNLANLKLDENNGKAI